MQMSRVSMRSFSKNEYENTWNFAYLVRAQMANVTRKLDVPSGSRRDILHDISEFRLGGNCWTNESKQQIQL